MRHAPDSPDALPTQYLDLTCRTRWNPSTQPTPGDSDVDDRRRKKSDFQHYPCCSREGKAVRVHLSRCDAMLYEHFDTVQYENFHTPARLTARSSIYSVLTLLQKVLIISPQKFY